MVYFGIGIFVFVLYILYDINSVLWNHRLFHCCFFAGTLLLAGATVHQTAAAVSNGQIGRYLFPALAAAAVFLILLIYTLFFALPFEDTYVKTDSGKAAVYDKGMYALCRHPGVLWLFLFYMCLGIAFSPSDIWKTGLFYSLLDLLYVIVQDVWTFPRSFADYESYQRSTPFLIPDRESVRRACSGRD